MKENTEYNMTLGQAIDAMYEGKAVQGDGFSKDTCILKKNQCIWVVTKGYDYNDGSFGSDLYVLADQKFKIVSVDDFIL